MSIVLRESAGIEIVLLIRDVEAAYEYALYYLIKRPGQIHMRQIKS